MQRHRLARDFVVGYDLRIDFVEVGMRIGFLAVAVVATLSGCAKSREGAMEDVCKELIEFAVVNPKQLQINHTSVLSEDLAIEEATQVLEQYSGKSLSPAQNDALHIMYKPGREQPKVHFVSLDYTDQGVAAARRFKAICRYYSDDIKTILLAADLAGNIQIAGMSEIIGFSSRYGQPKKMDISGQLKP